MKKIFFAILLMSGSAYSASPKVFKAVLDLAAVKDLKSIESLHVKKTFRCPDCYELCVRGYKNAADQELTHLLVTTHYDEQKQEVVAETAPPAPTPGK